jgi:diphosphomevalonate decarboxylase
MGFGYICSRIRNGMTATKQFFPQIYRNFPKHGKIAFQAPSNIALVKYWGKYGEQLPKNASISFTLDACHTQTLLHYKRKGSKDYQIEVKMDGKRVQNFEPKILKFFERINAYMPFLKDYEFVIETTNSFPHSSGIASSASGMSALALCLMELEQQLLDLSYSKEEFLRKASFLARLGSGSAARSIEGPLVVWGEHEKIEGSSNLFGTKFPFSVHKNFQTYQDTILLVETGQKEVSSTVGHNLMINHPFAESRFRQAHDNLSKLIPVLEIGDLDQFIQIVENEALSLHAMMLTSAPAFILMKPKTLEIIQRIWAFRKETGSHVCFTLDAGANVHVLYPESEKQTVRTFIDNELLFFCDQGKHIHDQTGLGARAM